MSRKELSVPEITDELVRVQRTIDRGKQQLSRLEGQLAEYERQLKETFGESDFEKLEKLLKKKMRDAELLEEQITEKFIALKKEIEKYASIT